VTKLRLESIRGKEESKKMNTDKKEKLRGGRLGGWRNWRWLLLGALIFGAGIASQAAYVNYRAVKFTGSPNNRQITISQRTDVLGIFTNGVFGAQTLQPTNGTILGLYMLPGPYWITIDQVSKRFPFDVPDGTNTYELWGLVNNGLYVYSPTNPAVAGHWTTNGPLGGIENDTGPVRIDTRSLTNQFSMMLNSNVWISTNGGIFGNLWALNPDGSIQWAFGASALNADGSILAPTGLSTTPLNASQLSSGTVPDGRFPATLPAVSGANLTALNASQLSGTVPDARLSSNVPLKDAQNNFTASNSFASLGATNLYVRIGGSLYVPVLADGVAAASRIVFFDPTNGTERASISHWQNQGHNNETVWNSGGTMTLDSYGGDSYGYQMGHSSAGTTPNGDIFWIQYDVQPTASLPASAPFGMSKYLVWVCRYWDTSAGSVKARVMGFKHNALDKAGNTELAIYSRVKGYNQNFSDDAGNVQVGAFGTNAFGYLNLVASNSITGSGSGITNLNYAVFTDSKTAGTDGDSIASSATWTKATLNTTGLDSASAFSLSSSVLTVNAAGAGKWKVRARVPFFGTTANMFKVRARVRRTNNTAATLLASSTAYGGPAQWESFVVGVVTLSQGDTLELQGWVQTGTPSQFGKSYGSDGEAEVYSAIEFERQ
jgi:hypothetical protein